MAEIPRGTLREILEISLAEIAVTQSHRNSSINRINCKLDKNGNHYKKFQNELCENLIPISAGNHVHKQCKAFGKIYKMTVSLSKIR